jgi:hypothetical protein
MNSIIRSTQLLHAATLLALLMSTQLAAAQTMSCISPAATTSTEEPVRMVFGGDIVLGNSFVVEHIPKDWE